QVLVAAASNERSHVFLLRLSQEQVQDSAEAVRRSGRRGAEMRWQGRSICGGKAAGESLVTSMGISFFGGVDPESGVVVERGHELEGQSISGKVLIFPTDKGSTVGSYTLYRLKRAGKAPPAY